MATRFGRVLQADVGVTLSQDRMQEVTDFIEKCSLIDGKLVSDAELTTGQDNEVGHGLNRPPQWIYSCRPKRKSVVSTSSTLNRNPKNSLILNCSANVTVSLWVF